MIHYPYIDRIQPIAFQLGPLAIHWYGLMYLGGFLGGWALAEYRRRQGRLPVSRDTLGDLMFYTMLGVVLGGRIGYMVFYVDLGWIWRDPLALFRVWDGGMSFHGGFLGVLAVLVWWSRRHGMRLFDTVDFVAPLIPLGLGLGRLGNFINGELWGKPTELPWGVIFPQASSEDRALAVTHPQAWQLLAEYGGIPRHPSQLYELALEGVLLFCVLWCYSMKPRRRYAVSGWFSLLYGVFRFAVEFVRLPDAQLGYRLGTHWLTRGMELSIPMIVGGIALLWLSRRAPVGLPESDARVSSASAAPSKR